MGKWSKGICAALVVVLLTAFCGMSCAFAVETEEYGAKYVVGDDPSMVDVDLIDFKVQLFELGFYSAGVGSATLQTRDLDDLTMAAVKLVCKLNPDLTYYNDGVSNLLYWRVMGEGEGELVTPLDEVYTVLKPGDNSDAVTRAQNRLNQLGYDAAGFRFTPGAYDDQMQKAIDEFVRCNKFVYERKDGITVEMQELLYSDEAIAYIAEERPEANLSEKVFGYLAGTMVIGGFAVPNYAVLAVGFVLLCVIVLLVVKLATPGKAKEENKQGSKKSGQGGKLKSGEIQFKIEYGSDTFVHRADIHKYVRIGRSTGDFPLNMADESVSRKHCEIVFENGNLMLRDFSSYGTKVNGVMCHHSQQMLHSGDVLEVGRHRITIQFQK